jgi:hypothetical protein
MSKAKTKSTKPKAAKKTVKGPPPITDANVILDSKKPAKVKAVKIERVVKNGVTQPGDGTACRAIWNLCDKLGKDITYEALREGIDSKIADATIRTQRQRHKVFNA